MTVTSIRTDVGGQFPGRVRWLNDCDARIWCEGHSDPIAVYTAVCHDGADIDDLYADLQADGSWIVGPRLEEDA